MKKTKTNISKETLEGLYQVLWTARLWHQGDKWRFSKDSSQKRCWEQQRETLQKALVVLTVLKESCK